MPLNLECSKMVAEMGMAQDNFPQHIWVKSYEDDKFRLCFPLRVTVDEAVTKMAGWPWSVEAAFYLTPPSFAIAALTWEWYAAPELLSGDPEHPGALEFIEGLGYSVGKLHYGAWYAFAPGNPMQYGERLTGDTPEALIAAVYGHWKAQREEAAP